LVMSPELSCFCDLPHMFHSSVTIAISDAHSVIEYKFAKIVCKITKCRHFPQFKISTKSKILRFFLMNFFYIVFFLKIFLGFFFLGLLRKSAKFIFSQKYYYILLFVTTVYQYVKSSFVLSSLLKFVFDEKIF